MNYTLLAKELDDAGFPHNTESGVFIDGKMRPYPTLSELIEACGDGFKWLSKCDGWWEACPTEITFEDLPSGSTPEEAVAKLWLELNKK